MNMSLILMLDQTFSYFKLYSLQCKVSMSAPSHVCTYVHVHVTFHYIIDQATNVIVHNAVDMFISPLFLFVHTEPIIFLRCCKT